MLRWWSTAATIALFLLLMFFAASATDLALFEDPTPLFRGARPVAALIGVSLLIADVFLPVPSSLVMVAHGTLFGVAGGTLLSLAGSIASALVGFAVGRWSSGTIRRLVSEREYERAAAMLSRWGAVAIAVSRPVPILAETVAILAGSSPLRWRNAALAAAAGSLVPSAVYAWTGAHVQSAANHALIFGGVLLVTGVVWWVGVGRR
ncbi:MAG TPA: VTT domain-containing protein [Thermoanaerobaculia bacterium]|nr:VTT domain-containing protein [Thermoanaerobaculia bacterium]